MARENEREILHQLLDEIQERIEEGMGGEEDDGVDKIDYSKPFRVIVTTDYRDDAEKQATGDLAFQKGWCLGMYEYPNLTKKRPEGVTDDWILHNPELGGDSEMTLYNPLIFTDSGHFIWGIESDWGEDIKGLDEVFSAIAQDTIRTAIIRLTTGGISDGNLGKN